MADVSLRALRMRFEQRRGHAAVRSDRHRTTTTSGGRVTPTVIQRLHEVLSAERVELGSHGHHDFDTWVWMTQRTDTAIAAVERALASKDAEIAELRKDKERLDWLDAHSDDAWASQAHGVGNRAWLINATLVVPNGTWPKLR